MANFYQYTQNSLTIQSVLELTPNFLQQHQVQGLIFDFDGVLNGDSYLYPTKKIAQYLHEICEIYPVAIYSNANLPKRKEYIKEHFPKIFWVDIPPKKPSPDSLLSLCRHWDLPAASLLMVDDRLLTGGLSAFRAKTQFAHVSTPLTSYKTNLVREIFFSSIRLVEKALVKVVNFH